MKRLLCISIAIFLLLGLTGGCQEEPVVDPYLPLHFGINHYYDLVPSTGPYDRWLEFVPPAEAIRTTVDRRFFDEELLNAVAERSLMSDQAITEYAWELQKILHNYDYIPEDYCPVSGTTYINGIVRIVYANDSFVEMIDIIKIYGEPITGKEEYTRCYQYRHEKPTPEDGQMYVFVSAKDGHIIFIGGPHNFKDYNVRW